MLKSPWTVHILSLLLAFSASATELENLDFDLRRTPLYGQTITIDTTDQAACFEIQTELEKKSQKLKDLCQFCVFLRYRVRIRDSKWNAIIFIKNRLTLEKSHGKKDHNQFLH